MLDIISIVRQRLTENLIRFIINITNNFERSQIMKKAVRIIFPIFLALCILFCTLWYLFIYDRAFTRDVLLSFARYSESQGNHKLATWFYNSAYSQSADNDAVAIELAEQYKSSGNYTKAEYTLSNAIADDGGIDLYIALCKTYVEQDKLLDAVNMLDNITNVAVKEELEKLRPDAPTATPAPGFYSQYLSVTLEASGGTLYASSKGRYPSITDTPYSEPIPLSDGETTIYALTVAENGLVSPLSIFGYTVGGVITKVDFADAAMETAIRELLGVNEDKELFSNDLWTIKEFIIPGNAKDYSDLKHMCFLESLTIEKGASKQISNVSNLVNLTELSISNTNVSQEDLGIIAALPKLKNLTLQKCSLSGISPLQKAAGLEKLDVSDNSALRNIDVLRSLGNLLELNLSGNAVSDLAAISSLTNLSKLDISGNSVTSLAPISSLTRLTYLDASANAITALGDLGSLATLNFLNLSSNKLTDVKAIANCTTLTELNISANSLTDISKLNSLTKLTLLDFSHNQVTKIPIFPKDCALVTISGSNNKISSLEPLSGLKSLNIVNMDYNDGISSVKPLANCPVLIEVNVYATKVTQVSVLTDQSIIVNYNPVS